MVNHIESTDIKRCHGMKFIKIFHMWCLAWFGTFCNLKNVKNHHGGVFLFVKSQASACNFTKSKTLPWVFFTFFKLYKCIKLRNASHIVYAYTVSLVILFYAHSYLCFFFNFVTQGGIAMNCIFKMSLTSFIRIFRMNLPTFIRTTESISSSCWSDIASNFFLRVLKTDNRPSPLCLIKKSVIHLHHKKVQWWTAYNRRIVWVCLTILGGWRLKG